MRCPYCKAVVDKEGLVCVKCGHRLPRPGEKVRVRRERYILSQVAILGGVMLIIGFFSRWTMIKPFIDEISGLSAVTMSSVILSSILLFDLGGTINALLSVANYGIYALLFLPLAGLVSVLTLWNKRWAVWLVFSFTTIGLVGLACFTGVGWYIMHKTQPPVFPGFWLTWAGALWLWLAAILDLIINRGKRTITVKG